MEGASPGPTLRTAKLCFGSSDPASEGTTTMGVASGDLSRPMLPNESLPLFVFQGQEHGTNARTVRENLRRAFDAIGGTAIA